MNYISFTFYQQKINNKFRVTIVHNNNKTHQHCRSNRNNDREKNHKLKLVQKYELKTLISNTSNGSVAIVYNVKK
jgi:hypothetical protein